MKAARMLVIVVLQRMAVDDRIQGAVGLRIWNWEAGEINGDFDDH